MSHSLKSICIHKLWVFGMRRAYSVNVCDLLHFLSIGEFRTHADVLCCSVNITIYPRFRISFCNINLLYVLSNHKSLHILQILTLPFWNVQKSKSCSMSNIDFNFNSVCIWGSYWNTICLHPSTHMISIIVTNSED